MPAITRNNFDGIWLVPDDPEAGYTRFNHRPVREQADLREQIKGPLAKAMTDHHFPPSRVKDALDRLGFIRATKHLVGCLPRDERTRKGNFGEVVASEHLRQRYGYEMPVFKLRYRDHPNMPMRGEDMVGFVLSDQGRIIRLCIGEAKTSEVFDDREVVAAHTRLDAAYQPHPVSLSMIVNILWDAKKAALAAEVDRVLEVLASRRFPRDNWIFVITASRPRDPFGSIEATGDVLERLHCVNLHLPNLTSLVRHVFDHPLGEVTHGGARPAGKAG